MRGGELPSDGAPGAGACERMGPLLVSDRSPNAPGVLLPPIAEELRHANQLYATLLEANQAMAEAADRTVLLRRICGALVRHAGMRLAWVGWIGESGRRIEAEVAEGPGAGFIDGLFIPVDPARPEADGPVARALLEGTPQVSVDVETDPTLAIWRERLRQWGVGSAAAVPVREEGGRRGALAVYAAGAGYFTPEIVRLVQELAADVEHGLRMIAARRLLAEQAQALRESESRYRSLFEQNHAAVLLVDPTDGRIVDANPAACRFYELDHAEICTLSVTQFNTMRPEALRRMMAEMARGSEHGVFRFEHRLPRGGLRAVEVTSGPITVDGRLLLYSIVRDETERRRAEAELIASEARLRLALAAAHQGIYEIDLRTGEARVTPEYATMLGHDPAGFVETRAAWMERMHPDDRETVERAFDDYIAGRRTDYRVEFRQRTRDGGWLWLLSLGEVVERDAAGRALRVIGTHYDITERKRSEEELRERELRLREALFTAMDGYIESDAEGRVVEVNPAYVRLSRYGRDELLRLRIWELDADEKPEDVAARMETLQRIGGMRFQSRHRRKDGVVLDVEVSITYSPRFGGRYTAFIRDISERLRVARRLEVQGAALESAANAIVITDAEGRIEWVNEAFTRATGYSREEAAGHNPRILKSGRHPPEFYAEMWRTIRAGDVWRGEIHNVRKDGKAVHEDTTITPLRDAAGRISHFIAIKQDVTERRQLEQQLLRSQRMEGVGLLAGGIAHDLNNILSPILISVDILRRSIQDPRGLRTLDTVESAARRGAGIVKQVLTFSRGIGGERVPLRPRDVVRELVSILEETFPRTIEIVREFPAETATVLGDSAQLHQVLLNLAVNARDAMPGGGTLVFRIEDRLEPARPVPFWGEIKPGPYVILAVQDSGEGMTPEVQERVWEPFFTTKPQGKGTGLGLPTVFGIVRSHGGFIEVESAPGGGRSSGFSCRRWPRRWRWSVVRRIPRNSRGSGARSCCARMSR